MFVYNAYVYLCLYIHMHTLYMYVLCYLHPEQTSYLTSAHQKALKSAAFMQKKNAGTRCQTSGKYLPEIFHTGP